MNKLILKITSQKKLAIIGIIILLAIIGFGAYILIGVQNNVEKMGQVAEVTYYPPYPPINTAGKNLELIRRGEYLAKAGDCMACHTNTAEKEKAKPFAGGLAMVTPFGTIYSPNITPDKKTGIGNWTDDDFIKAMRKGISPSGHYYYPAFPYLYFSKITEDDLRAIKAYLDSIPSVEETNRANDMLFPFNIRFLQLGWRILFFHTEDTEVYKSDSTKSVQWNRGAYLSDGLGHCAMCHSPSYHILSENVSLGAPIRKYDLTGAKVQGFLAPNITEANLSKISEQEIVDVFTKDHLIGGGKIEGPMLEVNHDSLRYLTNEDLFAIANYLKAVQSEAPPKPTGANVGKAIYGEFCAGCHTTGGGGAPKFGDAAGWAAVLKENTDQIYTNAIVGKGGMPAKGTCLACSDDEIKQAVDYMLEAAKGKQAVYVPKKIKPLTLEDGKVVYQKNCGVCHDSGFKNAPKPGDISAWKPIVQNGFLNIYMDVLTGKKGHPPHGACEECSDAEIKAAIKYMLQSSCVGECKDYSLW